MKLLGQIASNMERLWVRAVHRALAAYIPFLDLNEGERISSGRALRGYQQVPTQRDFCPVLRKLKRRNDCMRGCICEPPPRGPAGNTGSLRLPAAKGARKRCNSTPSTWDPVGNSDHHLANSGILSTPSLITNGEGAVAPSLRPGYEHELVWKQAVPPCRPNHNNHEFGTRIKPRISGYPSSRVLRTFRGAHFSTTRDQSRALLWLVLG
jgi:hypothetical protein